jgi:hypothetical protein
VLNPFLFDGAQYVASGRVTAMAISPNCSQANAPSTSRRPEAVSGAPTRRSTARTGNTSRQLRNERDRLAADGSKRSSGNTLYAGTGEPNASADSEAGVGIYKTTDGGQTWALVPGSEIFFNRSIGQMALDNAGNLLVPIDSGVRGISSTGGAVGRASSSTAASARALSTNRRYFHLDPPAERGRDGPWFHDGQGRSYACRSHLRQRVLAWSLALDGQRCNLDADQDTS